LNPDAMGDAERRVRWVIFDRRRRRSPLTGMCIQFQGGSGILFVSWFDLARIDKSLFVDMVFLYKLMLEPTALFFGKNESGFKSGSIWLLSQIRPMWRFWDTNPEGTVAGCKVTIRDSNHSLYLGAGP